MIYGAITFWSGTHRWEGSDSHGVLAAAAASLPPSAAPAAPAATPPPAAAAASAGVEPLGDFYSYDLKGHRQALSELAAARGLDPSRHAHWAPILDPF